MKLRKKIQINRGAESVKLSKLKKSIDAKILKNKKDAIQDVKNALIILEKTLG